jgi:hypothetical protein
VDVNRNTSFNPAFKTQHICLKGKTIDSDYVGLNHFRNTNKLANRLLLHKAIWLGTNKLADPFIGFVYSGYLLIPNIAPQSY